MEEIAAGLTDEGFIPTDRESPVHEEGVLWTNGDEMVCNRTSVVIDGDHNPYDPSSDDDRETRCGEVVYRYENSENVKLPGGYTGSYEF